jgi:hypothetical protein
LEEKGLVENKKSIFSKNRRRPIIVTNTVQGDAVCRLSGFLSQKTPIPVNNVKWYNIINQNFLFYIMHIINYKSLIDIYIYVLFKIIKINCIEYRITT